MFRLLISLWSIFTSLLVCSRAVGLGNLSILLIVSDSARFNTSGAAIGFDLALNRINREPSLLSGYDLTVSSIVDDKCDGSTAVREILTQIQLFPSPTLIGVIGCGCSVATQSVADMVLSYGLSLISYTPSGIVENGAMSNGHYDLYPSERNLVLALVSMVKTFKWSRISMLTQNKQPFIQIEDMVIQEFSTTNITVIPPSRFSTGQEIDRDNLFINDSHVNLINCFEDMAIQLICKASKSARIYPDYAWILYGWYSEEWWRSTNGVNCTEEELASVLERALVIQQYPINDNMSINGELQRNSFRPFVETLAYDSVWTLALALNRTMSMINTNDTLDCGPSPAPLEEFSYGNSSTACLIRHSLSKTNFTGLSGPVMFAGSGVRKQDMVRLLQYRNGSSRLSLQIFADIGIDMQELLSFNYISEENESTVWPDGIPPDGSTITVISIFHVAAVVFMYAFGVGGIIFCIVCLIFNIVFRKRRIVRLTSPNLNYSIIAGAILIYVSVFVSVPFSTSLVVWDVCCKMESIVTCLGYALIFGPILAKMWRIYYIFHNPTPKKKNITDRHLGIFVALVVSVVVVLLLIGFSIPATLPRAFTSPDGENRDRRNERGILQTFFIVKCYPMQSLIWLNTLYFYLAILQIAALVLTLRIRKVKIKAVNDSKEIAIMVHFTTIAAVESLLLEILLQGIHLAKVLSTAHVMGAATVIAVLTFVPKMISLWRDPQGEKVFTTDVNTEIPTLGEKTKIAQLEQEILSLKQQLKNPNDQTQSSS